MTMEADVALSGDCYLPARDYFEKILAWARGPGAYLDHAVLEKDLDTRGEELMRRVYQGWLDERSHAEAREHERTPIAEGVTVRSYTRQIENGFGRVTVRRLGYEVAGRRTRFPLDKQLRLPESLYSHPLQERVVEEARVRAWDGTVERINRTTGGHVPKRQAQELAITATQDFEEFYKQRVMPKAIGAPAPICGSSDGKGVRVLHSALREGTQKAAAVEKAAALRGDPMAPKKLRSHDKRMAIVNSVWEQEPWPRQASDIISELHRTPKTAKATKARKRAAHLQSRVPEAEPRQANGIVSALDRTPRAPRARELAPKAQNRRAAEAEPSDLVPELNGTPKATKARKRGPRPQNKRVWASVVKSVAAGVSEMFDEFDRRDHERARRVVVLVDGDENQQTAILGEARKRNRTLTIVLDIIHVIHYLWLAGYALCHSDRKDTDIWVRTHLLMLLSGPATGVIEAIEAAVTTATLSTCETESVNKALRYLRRNASFLDYVTYLAQGLPIATGIIEGACRHLIQDRLGITGARWSLRGAEAMLRLRSIHSSADWDAYWRFHLEREAARNYANAA